MQPTIYHEVILASARCKSCNSFWDVSIIGDCFGLQRLHELCDKVREHEKVNCHIVEMEVTFKPLQG